MFFCVFLTQAECFAPKSFDNMIKVRNFVKAVQDSLYSLKKLPAAIEAGVIACDSYSAFNIETSPKYCPDASLHFKL